MNIACDIDGVITNMDYIKIGKRETSFLDFKDDVISKNAYIKKMVFLAITKFITFSKVRQDAALVLDVLKSEGNNIVLITNRFFGTEESFEGKTVREITKRTLGESRINHDALIFATGFKVEECLDNGIDVIIEDNVNNIRILSEYLPVIVFDTPYNRHISGENIYRAKSWLEVYELIKVLQISKEKKADTTLLKNNGKVYSLKQDK